MHIFVEVIFRCTCQSYRVLDVGVFGFQLEHSKPTLSFH